MNRLSAYATSAAAVSVTSLAGSLFTNPAVKTQWYRDTRPSFTPPSAVFPIVWTILYVLLAVAFARALASGGASVLIKLYAASLVLNVAWSAMYFGLRSATGALPIVLSLLATALWILHVTWRAGDRVAFYCVLPYAMWLCFAFALNVASSAREGHFSRWFG